MTMIISKNMQNHLNTQIVHELYSSNAYLAVASYMESRGLKVMAGRFFQQADEERIHALKILKYILDTGAQVKVGEIPAPKSSYKSIADAIKASLDQEVLVTRQINDLMALAHKEKDYATSSFLQWFVDEQVEEVSTITELLQLVELAGDERILMVEERLMRLGVQPSGPVTGG